MRHYPRSVNTLEYTTFVAILLSFYCVPGCFFFFFAKHFVNSILTKDPEK